MVHEAKFTFHYISSKSSNGFAENDYKNCLWMNTGHKEPKLVLIPDTK